MGLKYLIIQINFGLVLANNIFIANLRLSRSEDCVIMFIM
jgi:hypothetical protein